MSFHQGFIKSSAPAVHAPQLKIQPPKVQGYKAEVKPPIAKMPAPKAPGAAPSVAGSAQPKAQQMVGALKPPPQPKPQAQLGMPPARTAAPQGVAVKDQFGRVSGATMMNPLPS